MRFPARPWFVFAALAVLIAALSWGIGFYRYRFVRSDRDLFRFLPAGDETVSYVNVAALRQAGVLRLFAASKTAEDSDYREFVRATGFDFGRDVEAMAGAVDDRQTMFIVRGRFEWDKLRGYAQAHGGECTGGTCAAPASKAGTWASFRSIQPDVLGLVLSGDRSAAKMLKAAGPQWREPIPNRPVWARISQKVLSHPADLPVAVRLFAISLQFANPVVLSLGPADEHSNGFKLELDAQCTNAAMADTVRKQLELNTKMLNLELAREHARANAADLTGLLTAGSFEVIDQRVVGTWPVRWELLKALE